MPMINGLDFIAQQMDKGCKCHHIALISGGIEKEHFFKARSLGLALFPKPFKLNDLKKWLEKIEKNIDPNRKLADWYLHRIQNNADHFDGC